MLRDMVLLLMVVRGSLAAFLLLSSWEIPDCPSCWVTTGPSIPASEAVVCYVSRTASLASLLFFDASAETCTELSEGGGMIDELFVPPPLSWAAWLRSSSIESSKVERFGGLPDPPSCWAMTAP